jgi:hypothetical protein
LRSLDLGLVDGGADLDRVVVRPLVDERCSDGGQGLVLADPSWPVDFFPRRDPFESVHPWHSGTVGDEIPDAGLGEVLCGRVIPRFEKQHQGEETVRVTHQVSQEIAT